MQNFIREMRNRLSSDEESLLERFYTKLTAECNSDEQKSLIETGEENTLIILPLELDYDIIFAGLLLPLIRQNKIDLTNFTDYQSAIKLAQSVLTIESIDTTSSDEAGSLRSMLVAMAKDIRVIILKLADVLNQERHSKKLSNQQQSALHKQVVDLYIPLSSRLGLSYIKSELQDLDLSYTHPNEYRRLMKELAEDSNARKQQMEIVIEELKGLLKELNIEGQVYGRLKHISSVYNKISQKNYSLNQIYDLTAVRVLVNTTNECYSVLGAVHTKYMPLDGRFKDYIARPKANGYQSLHTTVMVGDRPLEIQIRTVEMHNHAEYGIAAHFLYKEHKNGIDELDSKLLWIRKLIENPNLTTSAELISELKTDVYSGEIFVQTPMGKIIELPENSTPIDFAYAIHSNIGNTCVGAKVNGKIVPINKKLSNADVVEIITNANAKGPSRDWLNFVQSSGAKTKINQFFKKEMKDDNIKRGKSMLEQTAKIKEVDLKGLFVDKWLDDVFAKYSLKNVDDMYAMIGCGGLTTTQVLNRLIADFEQENIKKGGFIFKPVVPTEHAQQETSAISELDSMMTKFAHCCNPVPGDDIVGFVSRGHGVTIHRKDCKALKSLDADRLMPLSWNDSQTENINYVASLRLVVKDTSGMLANIVNRIAEQKINMTSINSQDSKDGKTIIDVKVSINGKKMLDDLITKLRGIENVYEITRGENK